MINFATLLTLCFPQKGADLAIVNQTDDPIFVYSDGEFIGRIRAQQGFSFEQKPGEHRISALDQDGNALFRRNINITKDTTSHLQIEDPHGSLTINNDSGTPLYLKLNGHRVGRVDVGENKLLEVSPGKNQISAFYKIKGEEILLQRARFDFSKNEEKVFSLQEATSGWVMIDNDLKKRVEVRIDGVVYDHLKPSEAQLFNTTLGEVQLSVFSVNGRELFRQDLDVEPYRSLTISLADGLALNP